MTVSRTAGGGAKAGKAARKEPTDGVADHNPLQIGELAELLERAGVIVERPGATQSLLDQRPFALG